MTSGVCQPAAETINPSTAATTTGAVMPDTTDCVTERRLVPWALRPRGEHRHLQHQRRDDKGGITDDIGGNGKADVHGVVVARGRSTSHGLRAAAPEEQQAQERVEAHGSYRGNRDNRHHGRGEGGGI